MLQENGISGEDLETRVCQVYLDNCKANAAEKKGWQDMKLEMKLMEGNMKVHHGRGREKDHQRNFRFHLLTQEAIGERES